MFSWFKKKPITTQVTISILNEGHDVDVQVQLGRGGKQHSLNELIYFFQKLQDGGFEEEMLQGTECSLPKNESKFVIDTYLKCVDTQERAKPALDKERVFDNH
jgi:hypothetical protein